MSRQWVAVVLVLAALIGAWATPHDPQRADVDTIGLAPSWAHPLGTDHAGRDVLARVLYGARYSLMMLLVAGLTACSVGILLGIAAGYSEGAAQRLVGHTITALLGIPPIVLGLLLLTLLERHPFTLAVISGIVQAPALGVAVAERVRQSRRSDYWVSSLASGADWRYLMRSVIFRDLVPFIGLIGPTISAYAFLTASTLSYLGMGGDPGLPEWGAMLAEARSYLHLFPLTAIVPGGLILLTLLLVQRWATPTR